MVSNLTVQQFLDVVELSKLLSKKQIEDATEQLRGEGFEFTDADSAAQGLVQLGLLNPWQTSRLLRGKHKGFVLGKYRLLSRLGTGAMGAVYLAEHAGLKRQCAVKVLPASRVGDASYLERFLREAQAVAALSHPNIVRAYDVDSEGDGDRVVHYLAMEFVDGEDTQHIVARGPLDFVQATDIVRQAAEGLAHAHDAGLIHRDIKPANLLLDKHGVVKVLDLGLAKDVADDEKASLTQSHDETVLGTADYLSPEQALSSHDVDHRSDIYSLGCTFYCLLTGRPPFNEGSVAQRLAGHMSKKPTSIRELRPDIPPELVAVVEKMMAKEPGDRFQTAKDVSESLSAWLAENTDDAWKQAHLERVGAGLETLLRVEGAESLSKAKGTKSSLKESAEPAVGIDLGTTFSVIAILDENGNPTTVRTSEGDLITPSVVYFDEEETVVGKEAVKAAVHEPDRVAMYAKRDVGDSEFHKPICGQHLPPEVIESLILSHLKSYVAPEQGDIKKAVITVPAYFNEPRRKATQDAGRLAGLDVLDIINEPTAAAIAYGVRQGFVTREGKATKPEILLVYDLGGGTFDVTLMEINGSNYTAIATAGDAYLGGIDWDKRIVTHVCNQFMEEHDIELSQDDDAIERLMPVAADAKKSLSVRDSVKFHFAHRGKKIRVKLDRDEFERISSDLLDRTRLTVNKLLRESKLSWSDVTRLLLVGGSTRMPMVRTMLEQESGLRVDRSLSPDEAVAHGAAIYAGILLEKGISAIQGISVQNVNSHSLGILGIEPATKRTRRHVMIPRNTTLPAKKSCVFRTNKDGQKSVLVNVVEGGTDSGANATHIGKCVVTDLPADLPAKTEVRVTFRYAENGRLTVSAALPSINRKASLTIERASGLSNADIEEWSGRIRKGRFLGEQAKVSGDELQLDIPSADELDSEFSLLEDDQELNLDEGGDDDELGFAE